MNLRESVTFEVTNGLDSEKETVDKIIAMCTEEAIEAVKTHAKEIDQVVLFVDDVEKAINDIKERK